MASFTQFLSQKLVSLLHGFLLSVLMYLLPLFRLRKYGNSLEVLNHSEENNVKRTSSVVETESESEKDITEFRDFENDVEKEKSEAVFLSFKFPNFDEFRRSRKEESGNNTYNSEVVPFTSKSQIEFPPENSISAFIDEHAISSAKDARNGDLLENRKTVVDESLLEKRTEQVGNRTDDILEEGKENENAVNERTEFSEEVEQVDKEEEEFPVDGEDQFRLENNSAATDSDSESTSFEHIRSVMSSLVDSYSEGFPSDRDFGGEFDFDSSVDSDGELSDLEEDREFPNEFDGEDSDIIDELGKLEQENLHSDQDRLTSDFLSDNDFNVDSDKKTNEQFLDKNGEGMNGAYNSQRHKSKGSSTSSSEDANKLEPLWEHQELIEQLKMELRKVRGTGLPTILEESESPKITDDLKPWKIDERFHIEDCIDELQKFYKCYRERMRKFDILNYQKMYAIGFLQLKDPLQLISESKPSAQTTKSLLPRTLSLFKHGSHDSDPANKFVKELESDLEVVYVGQMCLSWEFLHWQYEKALDLWDSDPRGIHRYNEVSGEFQQFQVLMQRFIEDEPFQGPRVHNYIKNRCVLRNLLQVPVIKVDSLKDKKKARLNDMDEYVITSDMLVEILEESVRIFWRFVRADKRCRSGTAKLKGDQRTPELHNPGDLELFMEVRKTLQKKERKLKEILRSENCILRRFQRYRDDDSDQVLYFFCQVDMKLVSRVLNMSRISKDQLIWCRDKLSRISFANRKIYVQPVFLLFPC